MGARTIVKLNSAHVNDNSLSPVAYAMGSVSPGFAGSSVGLLFGRPFPELATSSKSRGLSHPKPIALTGGGLNRGGFGPFGTAAAE